MTARRIWRAVVLGAGLVATVIAVVLVASRGDRTVLTPAPGASLGESSLDGGALGVPGELTGVGGLGLTVRKGREYTVESWRFREVSPRGTRVAYRLRPSDAYGGTSCPGSGLGFTTDGPTAAHEGDQYPCRMERPGTQRVTAAREWDLIAVFWASRTPGTVMRVAGPEAIVRDGDGRRYRVQGAAFKQSICVMGGSRCARWLAHQAGFATAEAEKKVALICGLPRRPPLFAGRENRPPTPREIPHGTDASGRPCAIPGH